MEVGAVNITRFILEYSGEEESLIVGLELSTDTGRMYYGKTRTCHYGYHDCEVV